MKLYIAKLGSTLPKSLTSGLRAVLLLLYLFLTIPAHAIHDTNQNGVSDPWERKNNNGNLIVDFDPTADPTETAGPTNKKPLPAPILLMETRPADFFARK